MPMPVPMAMWCVAMLLLRVATGSASGMELLRARTCARLHPGMALCTAVLPGKFRICTGLCVQLVHSLRSITRDLLVLLSPCCAPCRVPCACSLTPTNFSPLGTSNNSVLYSVELPPGAQCARRRTKTKLCVVLSRGFVLHTAPAPHTHMRMRARHCQRGVSRAGTRGWAWHVGGVPVLCGRYQHAPMILRLKGTR